MECDRSKATPAPTSTPTPSLSRRQLLAAAGAVTAAVTAVGPTVAAARPRSGLSLSFTAATNGSATLAPGGDSLIAEVQNVLWSLPRTGGKAVPLTPAGLEPNRPVLPLVPAGLSLHLGLRALHRGGLSPVAALRTATVLPARLFGVDDDLGTVQPGRLADLTVVDGDPFTDFDTLVRTVSVLRGGVPYTTEDLVAAYEPAARRSTDGDGGSDGDGDRDDWLEVGRLMRREGCCDAGA